MTQDYWGRGSRCGDWTQVCGPGAGACNEHCPDRGEGREREQKTNQNMSPSAGSASEAQGPWQCWPRFFSSECLFFCISCLKYMILVSEYCYTVYLGIQTDLTPQNATYFMLKFHFITFLIQWFIMFSFTFHLFLFKNILCHLPCLMYLLK